MKENHSNAMHRNGGFGTSLGFVLACVGSAVGMGNIWLFPYRLGQYGGAAFLIPYIIFIALFGLVGLSAEFAIGRRAQTGTLGAYEYCFASRGKGKLGYMLGWIPLFGSLGIAIGYSIILGWVLKSLLGCITGSLLTGDAGGFFTAMSGTLSNVPCHSAIVIMGCASLLLGATKGIEKLNKILMPAFFVLFVLVAVRVAFLPGAAAGYEFLFVPKWEQLANPKSWVMAMGQAFFSLSITGSGMIVYGSYLKKNEDIPKASMSTAIFDTCAAMVSALAIMPAVFAFGIEPHSGPSLLFITLPGVFAEMPMGQLIAVVFFLSVLFAGITSLMNMFEAVCESWQTRFGINRTTAVILCGAITLGVGLFMENGDVMGQWMDFISIVVTPFGALLGAISVYYILGFDNIKSELELGRKKALPAWFGPVAKYIYVPVTVIVFILGLLIDGGIG